MTLRGGDDLDGHAERRRRRIFVGFWSAVVLGVLVAFRVVLVPFVLGAIIAYILSPVVARLARASVGGRALPRWGAVLGLYAVILVVLGVTIRAAVPALAGEARDFARDELPRLRAEAETHWLPRLREVGYRFGLRLPSQSDPLTPTADAADPRALSVEPRAGGGFRILLPADGVLVERDSADRFRVAAARTLDERRERAEGLAHRLRVLGAGHTDDIIRVGRGIVGSIVNGIFLFFMTLMLSAYMLVTEHRILGFFRSLVQPAMRPAFAELLHRIDRGLSGVVRGQLMICAVNGVLSAVGFAIADLRYWPLLALLAALFSLVPIFGSILSSIPAVALGLTHGFGTGLFVLAWILGIHQLEANFLNPKIMGDQAKIHPVLVVFALLAGEHFFGILGALLAVPTMSLVQSVFLHWRKYALSYGDPRVLHDSLDPGDPAGPVAVRGWGADRPAGGGRADDE